MNEFNKRIDELGKTFEHHIEQWQEQRQVSRIKKHQALNEELQKTRQELLRYLVATSGMIFSILIGLGKDGEHPRLALWSYAISIVLLGLGILLLSIALYNLLYNQRKGLELYGKAMEKAYRENHPVEEALYFREPRIFQICEKIGLINLALAVVFLMVSVVIRYLL